VQYQRALGNYYLQRTGVTWAEVRGGAATSWPHSNREREAAARAYDALTAADQWGLLGVGEVKLGLAWLAILRGEPVVAERELRAAVALYPKSPRHHQFLAEFLAWRGRFPEAIVVMKTALRLKPSDAQLHFELAGLLAGRDR